MGWGRGPASFLCMWISTCHRPCWRDYLSLTEWSWHPYRKSTGHRCMGLLLGSQSYSIDWSIHLSLCYYHSFSYYSFMVSFGILNCGSSKFVFLSQYGFGYLEPVVVFHVNLWLNFSISARKAFGVLTGTALNLQITLVVRPS